MSLVLAAAQSLPEAVVSRYLNPFMGLTGINDGASLLQLPADWAAGVGPRHTGGQRRCCLALAPRAGLVTELFYSLSFGESKPHSVQRKGSTPSHRLRVSETVVFTVWREKQTAVSPLINHVTWSKWHSHLETPWPLPSNGWRKRELL